MNIAKDVQKQLGLVGHRIRLINKLSPSLGLPKQGPTYFDVKF